MTEADWLACDDPEPMFAALEGKVKDRKSRLLACACLRLARKRLRDMRSWEAIEAAERYADGQATEAELDTAREAALDVLRARRQWKVLNRFELVARAAVWAAETGWLSLKWASEVVGCAERCHLLRDLFGNHFREAVIQPQWLTDTVVGLAGHAYEERAFDCLPILADALEDAGCTDRALLDHCRGPGPHVRGCWVIDLILGKQ
jgi:hypothetical protein